MGAWTQAANRTRVAAQSLDTDVCTVAQLERAGCTRAEVRARIAARRWQRIGRAIVTHGGPLTTEQRRRAAVLNGGPRAALTSFTALEAQGLRNWSRDEVHLLTARGARVAARHELRIVGHTLDIWRPEQIRLGHLHRVPHAAVLAAASLDSPRAACGLLAAVVQQRLSSPAALLDAISGRATLARRHLLCSALDDVAMGAQALSEIDFVRLCRRFQLPAPTQQSVRVERSGRRRYLDASWIRGDGRTVAVEVDGALHLNVATWWSDQLRQNELVLDDTVLLRYPSVVVRTGPAAVAEQLRRALQL